MLCTVLNFAFNLFLRDELRLIQFSPFFIDLPIVDADSCDKSIHHSSNECRVNGDIPKLCDDISVSPGMLLLLPAELMYPSIELCNSGAIVNS